MSCNSTGTCGGSGCLNKDDATITSPAPHISTDTLCCYKCKTEPLPNNIAKSTNNLCTDCFTTSIFAKFKQSVTTQDLISLTDNVLLAFSGGPASRVALQFVHDMQHKAQMNLNASRDKLYPVFGVGVAFIDESAAVTSILNRELDELENAIRDLRMIVSSLSPPEKELYVVPIESVFSSDLEEGRRRMNELLDTVGDATGREDLLGHFRMMCLQKIASENKYSKLILGSCSSRIACHVISATVKGQGYSLPADIQYIDARWEVPVVLPLRDCLVQELNILCRLNSLKTLDLLEAPRSGINGLVSTFIKLLQEENPARERTIVRTAEKLTPFHFNRLKEVTDPKDNFQRRHRKKLNLQPYESIPSEFLCPICCSPINKLDFEGLHNKFKGYETNSTIFCVSCCPSCQFQILPKETSTRKQFCSLLPEQVITRAKDFVHDDQTWLREQIKDCLLSDSEDET